MVSMALSPGGMALEEDAHEVTVRGLDLLAHDDRQALRAASGPRAPHRSDRDGDRKVGQPEPSPPATIRGFDNESKEASV
jgi:hypothetical protein